MVGEEMERLYNNGYRTLFGSKLGLIQLVDYRFEEDMFFIDWL